MNISDVLAEAVADLEAAQIPKDLRPIAFGRLLDFKLGGIQPSRIAIRNSVPIEHQSIRGDGPARISGIAQKLGIDLDVLGDVYHEEGDQLGLGVGPTKLDTTTARATKQVALLVAAGRQAGEYDDGWTSIAVIREFCRDYNRLDTANFASTILGMSKVFTFKGKAQSREVHVTRPGWDEAKALVQKLTGTES